MLELEKLMPLDISLVRNAKNAARGYGAKALENLLRGPEETALELQVGR